MVFHNEDGNPARANIKQALGRNSKVQEVSQHSESKTPNVKGEHRRGRRIRRSRSMSGSPEHTSVFSRIRRDRSESPRHKPGEKEEETEEYSIGWEIKEKVCSHTRKAVTRVTSWEEQNPFPENVTMKEHVHGGHKCSPKVKIAEGNTGSQNQKSKGSCKGGTLGNTDMMPYGRGGSFQPSTKKKLSAWKQQEAGRKQNFDRRGDFRNQQRSERRRDKFTLLTKSPKEILAPNKGKFKAPPPMTTPIEKRNNNNKFCEFHGEVGHNTDECMHLRIQIEELINSGKLSHVIKELKQGSGKDQPKAVKKGETSGKDKPLAILMVQPWQRVAR
ncbi:hypothetical protein Tco_0452047 [Tanacetum coccineum]